MSAKIQNSPDNYKQNYKNSYADYFKGLPWSYWITGTTRYPLSEKSNRRLLERWYWSLSLPGSRLLFVAEPFDLRDGFHSHSLLYVPDDRWPISVYVDNWQWATGNKDLKRELWSRIQIRRYDSNQGAAGYCAKYLFKADSDYDLLVYNEEEKNNYISSQRYNNYNYSR